MWEKACDGILDKSRQGISTRRRIFSPRCFDVVDWDALELALKGKPQMYKLWYGKQCTGFCATNSKIVQWGKSDDS